MRLWCRFSMISWKIFESWGTPVWIIMATGGADSFLITILALNPI